MSQTTNDEIDLIYVIQKIKALIKNWIVLLFKALDFCLKYWYILLALVVIGFGLGYYQVKNAAQKQNALTVVKVNYELQSYVYNAIESYNIKAREYDSLYLKKIGFNPYSPQIKEISIEPIVDFRDIFEEYKYNDRSLEMFLRNVDFDGDEEEPLRELFSKKYNYYELLFKLSSKATSKDVEKFISHLNKEPKLQAYKEQAKKTLIANVAENDTSISLINNILKSYVATENTELPRLQVDTDLAINTNTLLDAKQEIQKNNQKQKNELILAQDIVVPLQDTVVRKSQKVFKDKKYIIYPILFVFGFLFIAYLVYLYKYLRKWSTKAI